ncbi:origin recognition complex subunit 4 C-terminus-domain-containing protein, partial [Flammula alnicola]
ALPEHLYPCFHAYKRAILKTLQCPNVVPVNADQPSVNDVAAKQLTDLIDGTVLRAEGNSCLLLGPRGSGKSQVLAFEKPIILRLSGWVQSTDRHALREIAFQLLQQTGSSLLPDTETDQSSPVQEGQEEEENPFLDSIDTSSGEPTLSLPPSSHLHALIPVLLTLSRPVVVILDAFDLFALHPRQSLLYCLLDTVQNCRASSDSRGIAVIGITSRVDTVQLLEKRVKSRFSGRTIRTAPPGGLQSSLALVRSILQPSDLGDDDEYEEWKQHWTSSVDRFLTDKNVVNVFNETFSITRDLKVITRMLTTCVLRLTSTQPYLSFRAMSASVDSQRSRHRNLHLTNLSYPSLCLLIASAHADTAGHTTFTFEMLYETFRDQVRASTSAPVQVNGGSIGMTFEDLIAARIFACVVGPSSNTAKEFMKHRCVVDRNVIKGIIEKSGQTNLKKWLNKGQ